jgi:Tfp pilus assembly protein PilF
LEQLEKAVEMDPTFMSAHIKLGWVYQQKKMHDKAIAEFQTALALSENETAILCLCGEAYALAGDRARAYEIIEHLKIRPEPTYISPYWKAIIYVALGATQPALEQLQLAQKLHCFSLVWLQVEPKFDPLRHLPEFQELARQMNFAGAQF